MAENENDAFRALVQKVIESYKKLLNQGMALDVCRVQGKMRAMILRDSEFIKETRAIRAEKYLNELNEIEDIYQAATRMGQDGDDYDDRAASGRDLMDGRKRKSGDKKKSNDKDALAMQLKAASMRRELMSLTADDASDNEESAVNFFFTALTREEMETMKQVEVNHGTASEDGAFKGMSGENTQDVAAQAKKRKQQTENKYLAEEQEENYGSDEDDMFEVLPDGTLREKS